MKPGLVLLGLVLLLDITSAAEESCVGRCGSFHTTSKCQCDSMCVYYGSCCGDFDTICPKKIARGDTFQGPEEEETTTTPTVTSTPLPPASSSFANTTATVTAATTRGPTPPADPAAEACSGRPFDAFLQMKNSSIYAFRGEYFFELDDKSVLPGYPKLIEDVWGIPGPIDAAFTRINCQGQSYFFKGNKYWRFNNDVLDGDYPRDISVGFDGIPDGVNAAFALPTSNHLGRERAYFFKGDQYYLYEFRQQPTHEECATMSMDTPSLLFTQYTDLLCDQTLEEMFAQLFRTTFGSPFTPAGPRLTSRDWRGIRPPIDAAIVGRVYLTPKPTPPPARRRSPRRRTNRRRSQRRRQSRHVLFDDLFGFDDYLFSDSSDVSDYVPPVAEDLKRTPMQNVYFFKKDKYYRVDLQTQRVAFASPPYPRSIAKYWLGCKTEGTPDTSRAEKR